MKQVIVIVMVMVMFMKVNAQSYRIVSENNGLAVVQGDSKTVLSTNADAPSVLDYKQQVYFLDKSANGSIRMYDVNTKKTTDVISIGMKSEVGYVVKSSIINMVADAAGGKIYFTTKDDYKGTTQHMTWKYDVNTKAYDVYCDGKALSLSPDNTLEVVFVGKDFKGEYQQKSYYNANYRQLIKQDEKVYTSIR